MKNTSVSAIWNGKAMRNALEKCLQVILAVKVQSYKKQHC